LVERPDRLDGELRYVAVAVAVEDPGAAGGEVYGIIDPPLCMRPQGRLARLVGIRLGGEVPASLLEVATREVGAHRQSGDDAARDQTEDQRISERRVDGVNLLGAGIRASGNEARAFHQPGIGDVELMREERAG